MGYKWVMTGLGVGYEFEYIYFFIALLLNSIRERQKIQFLPYAGFFQNQSSTLTV